MSTARHHFVLRSQTLEEHGLNVYRVTAPLMNIVTTGVRAPLCGSQRFQSAWEKFGNNKGPGFRPFLDLGANGTPSHDTPGRVFQAPKPEQFLQCFLNWVRVLRDSSRSVTSPLTARFNVPARSSVETETLHLAISAWARKRAYSAGPSCGSTQKSNEITAIPKILEMLN